MGQIEDRDEVGRLPGAGEHGAHSAFESSDLLLGGVAGGIADARVEKAVLRQVEERCHLLAGIVGEGGGQRDGQRARLAVGCVVARVNALGVDVHGLPPLGQGGGRLSADFHPTTSRDADCSSGPHGYPTTTALDSGFVAY